MELGGFPAMRGNLAPATYMWRMVIVFIVV
jgi:hypothetical protein